MAAKNDVTGDSIQTRVNSKAYTDNWDAIFKKPKQDETPEAVESQETKTETSQH